MIFEKIELSDVRGIIAKWNTTNPDTPDAVNQSKGATEMPIARF